MSRAALPGFSGHGNSIYNTIPLHKNKKMYCIYTYTKVCIHFWGTLYIYIYIYILLVQREKSKYFEINRTANESEFGILGFYFIHLRFTCV